ncbi:MAG: hypothetical protein LHW59_09525, partial [Candidatus Cloacimonetes bacterium]|nr:hypothetical protein [Candidatus Cloacimonadota bacterium]
LWGGKLQVVTDVATSSTYFWGGKLQVVTDVATSSTYLWGGKLQVVTDVATSSTYFWGGKLCLPQRAQLASEGSSAASAMQELGSPFPTRTERKPFLLATH